MLAVKVDFEARQATVGTKAGSEVQTDEFLIALEAIGYRGELAESPRK